MRSVGLSNRSVGSEPHSCLHRFPWECEPEKPCAPHKCRAFSFCSILREPSCASEVSIGTNRPDAFSPRLCVSVPGLLFAPRRCNLGTEGCDHATQISAGVTSYDFFASTLPPHRASPLLGYAEPAFSGFATQAWLGPASSSHPAGRRAAYNGGPLDFWHRKSRGDYMHRDQHHIRGRYEPSDRMRSGGRSWLSSPSCGGEPAHHGVAARFDGAGTWPPRNSLFQ